MTAAARPESLFDAFLAQHGDEEWMEVIGRLQADTHPVDRDATRIWFTFFPADLVHALAAADDRDALATRLQLLGRVGLRDQIDSSHRFLYGHRYWPEAKAAVAGLALSDEPPPSLDLIDHVRAVAAAAAVRAGVEAALTLGIAAVGLMTLQQVGAAAFTAVPGRVDLDPEIAARTADQVIAERTRVPRTSWLDRLRGARRTWTVTFDENRPDARFPLIDTQHLTTAAAADRRDYRAGDPRCSEGPIPVHCRSAACGTCWVGVLAGRDRLSQVEPVEMQRMREFGYRVEPGLQPVVRLACMAQATGPVSIVIPPWNGVFGRFLRGVRRIGSGPEEAP